MKDTQDLFENGEDPHGRYLTDTTKCNRMNLRFRSTMRDITVFRSAPYCDT